MKHKSSKSFSIFRNSFGDIYSLRILRKQMQDAKCIHYYFKPVVKILKSSLQYPAFLSGKSLLAHASLIVCVLHCIEYHEQYTLRYLKNIKNSIDKTSFPHRLLRYSPLLTKHQCFISDMSFSLIATKNNVVSS